MENSETSPVCLCQCWVDSLKLDQCIQYISKSLILSRFCLLLILLDYVNISHLVWDLVTRDPAWDDVICSMSSMTQSYSTKCSNFSEDCFIECWEYELRAVKWNLNGNRVDFYLGKDLFQLRTHLYNLSSDKTIRPCFQKGQGLFLWESSSIFWQ